MSIDIIAHMRQKLYRLSLSSLSDEDVYKKLRLDHIIRVEGLREQVYRDCRGNKTVGVGFNLDRHAARLEWDQAFCDTERPPDFDDIYQGKNSLPRQAIQMLLNHSLAIRQKELKRMYGASVWNRLMYNERLAIESIYYNQPGLVRTRRRLENSFFFLIVRYATQRCHASLQKAIQVVEKAAEGLAVKGMAQRRREEAFLLSPPVVY